MANGGKRPNAGRKPKADEIAIIEQMDAVLVPSEAWAALAALVQSGDVAAVKTWLNYRYGMPKQSIDMGITGEINPIQIIQLPDNGRDNSVDKVQG